MTATPPTVADAIEQTLEWLDRQGCTTKDEERRGVRRSRYRATAKISYTPPGSTRTESFEVATRNLSRTGLSFLHKTLIYPRQPLDVLLPLPDRSVRQISAKVIRARAAGHGMYEIGAEFTEMEVAVV